MTLLFTFLLMLASVAAMSIGVVLGRKPIAGSCGGMKALGLGVECEICGGDPAACEAGSGSGPGRGVATDLAGDAAAHPSRTRTRTL